jgi:beta-glucanase (GH16 family)
MRAGVCNAFWLYDPLNPPAKYREGSFSEEIDIFEIFGKPRKTEYDRVYCTTVHSFYTPYVESIANFKQTPLPKKAAKQKLPFDFWADYHVYGFLWTPTEMKWFVDGKEVFARDNDYYSTALYVMFDCEIMRDRGGPSRSCGPARHVRHRLSARLATEGAAVPECDGVLAMKEDDNMENG